MAALSECILLCQYPKGQGILGVFPSDSEDSVVITRKTKTVSVLKLSDQKVVKEWTVKQGQHFSSPAVYNHISEKCVSVINNQVIRHWAIDEVSLDKSKKITLNQPIHTILPQDETEPVVVFKNGSSCFLSAAKQEGSVSQGVASSQTIFNCSAHCVDGRTYCNIVTKNKEGDIQVNSQVVPDASAPANLISHINTHILAPPAPGLHLLGCCQQCTHSQLTIFVLWSNGTLTCSRMLMSGPSNLDTETCSVIPNLPSSSVAIEALDSTHLAIVGLTSEGKEGIGIWDLKFGTQLVWKPLPETSQDTKQLYCCRDHLFVPGDKTLQMFSYTTQPSTLSTVIGKFKDVPNTPSQDSIAPVVWKTYKQDKQEELSQNNAFNAYLELLDQKKTPKLTHFKSTFSRFMSECGKSQDSPLLTDSYLPQLVKRCITNKAFFPEEELLELIQTRRIPGSCSDELFTALIEHKSLACLHKGLMCVADIPERVLVQVVQFYLQLPDEEFQRTMDEEMKDEEEDSLLEGSEIERPVAQQKAHYLNEALATPYNDVFLLECIRKLHFENVLLLLKYLFYLLGTSSACMLQSKMIGNMPSLVLIVDWTSLLLDAHFTQLVLAPDTREILVNLHQTVQNQMHFYDELISLDGILSQLKKKSGLPQKPNIGMYSIEVLHIL